MAEAEAQLRDRLKSIVETEGSAVVEPSCLSDDSALVLESAFRSACEPVKILSKQSFHEATAPTRASPKGWMLIAAGVAVGLILVVVFFLTCRKSKRPSEDGKRTGRRQARRQRVEEDELEEEEEEEALPVIAKTKPTPEAHRPSPRRAARSKTETDEEEDPMFQPL